MVANRARRARIYDVLALLTALVIVGLDQWTKTLVVDHLSPPESQPPIPILGNYLTIYYLLNRGAAFSLFASNTTLVTVFILIAVAVICYLYIRLLNTGPYGFKIIFGMIIGGAAGNLLDRAIRGGSVVDFIFFRIPEIGFKFAVFNIADASISVGIFLLFVFVLFSGLHKTGDTKDKNTANTANTASAESAGEQPEVATPQPSIPQNETLHTAEHDV